MSTAVLMTKKQVTASRLRRGNIYLIHRGHFMAEMRHAKPDLPGYEWVM